MLARNNYLLAIARARGNDESRFALAWIDISTGEFRIAEGDRAALAAEIARLEPGEIIVSDALYGDPELAPYLRTLPAVTPLTRDVFDGATAERRLAVLFRPLHHARLRRAVAARAHRRRRLHHLRRAHAARPAPAAVAAAARGAGRDAPHRSGDAQQPRAGAHAGRRAARIAARRDRPQRHRGGLAAAGATAGRAPHRSRGDRDATRRSRVLRNRRRGAKRYARAAQGGTRSRPRAGAARGRPRRPARSRRHPRRHRRRRRACGRARESSQHRRRACAGGQRAARAGSGHRCRVVGGARRRASPSQARRLFRARGLRRRARRDARATRRIPPRDCGAAGALRRDHLRARAQDPPQQRAGIFRRGDGAARRKAHGAAAQRHLHPSPDARRTGALHHHRAGRA